MIITKDNYRKATPADVAEAMANGEMQVPLSEMTIAGILQVIAHIVEAVSQRPQLRHRVEALEHITQLQSAAIQQLLANH